jgi:hypothetical protein
MVVIMAIKFCCQSKQSRIRCGLDALFVTNAMMKATGGISSNLPTRCMARGQSTTLCTPVFWGA